MSKQYTGNYVEAASVGKAALKARRKRILIIYGIILVVGITYTVLIFKTGFGIPCFFNMATGLQCPGCGTSRMALAVMRLDFVSAFRYNPVAFISYPLWIILSGCCFFGHPEKLCKGNVLLGILYVNAAVYVIYGIVRNLPLQH